VKILHVSTFGRGGAYVASARLKRGIDKTKAIESYHITSDSDIVYSCFYSLDKKSYSFRSIILSVRKYLELIVINHVNALLRDPRLEYFSLPYSDLDLLDFTEYEEADIIHLHWVADFLDWESFFKKNKKPVVWTLHDQNPFLGGAHYNERFLGIDSAGNPKVIKRNYAQDFIEFYLQKKKIRILKSVKNLTVVSPSNWMFKEASKSKALNGFKHIEIPYAVPGDIFKLRDKVAVRFKLGLPIDEMLLLFVADDVSNSRKGFGYLIKAIERLELNNKSNLTICIIGKNIPDINLKNIKYFGNIDSLEDMALIYSAVDYFILPSLIDNLPNTMLESLMCGTPVIAFNSGGASTAIINGFNGLLAEKTSVEGLSQRIEDAINGFYVFNSIEIAEHSKSKYADEISATQYINLYAQLIDRRN
jgi:glycosyltransferase involved in cell wall biosynthesis